MINRLRDLLSSIFPALEREFDFVSCKSALVLLTTFVPVPNNSGRRVGNVHKPRRYSRSLRHALYLSAQTSMMRAGPNRAYYLKKRQQGRTRSQAVIALARRRVDVLWALLRDNRTWQADPPSRAAQAA